VRLIRVALYHRQGGRAGAVQMGAWRKRTARHPKWCKALPKSGRAGPRERTGMAAEAGNLSATHWKFRKKISPRGAGLLALRLRKIERRKGVHSLVTR